MNKQPQLTPVAHGVKYAIYEMQLKASREAAQEKQDAKEQPSTGTAQEEPAI